MSDHKYPEVMVEPNISHEEQSVLLKAARNVLLVWVGVLALAQEEIEDLIGRLIERGEIAEQDGRKLLREVLDKRREEATQAAKKVETRVTTHVDSVKDRITPASRTELEQLNEKIAQLTKQLDELELAETAAQPVLQEA